MKNKTYGDWCPIISSEKEFNIFSFWKKIKILTGLAFLPYILNKKHLSHFTTNHFTFSKKDVWH